MPFLAQHAAQLLVKALVISRLDYCNALLAGLPSNTIKPLHMIQNAAAWVVFSEPKSAHVTPLFISLHWLPVAAHIKFKTLMLAYRTATSTHWWQSTSPQEAWDLRATPRGAITERHKIIQIVFIHRFKAGRMNFPPLSGILNLWQFSSNTWKLISSVITWLHLKKKNNNNKKNTCSLSLTSPYPASICLEQCLELCITSTSCICLPLYNVSLILFINRKSL